VLDRAGGLDSSVPLTPFFSVSGGRSSLSCHPSSQPLECLHPVSESLDDFDLHDIESIFDTSSSSGTDEELLSPRTLTFSIEDLSAIPTDGQNADSSGLSSTTVAGFPSTFGISCIAESNHSCKAEPLSIESPTQTNNFDSNSANSFETSSCGCGSSETRMTAFSHLNTVSNCPQVLKPNGADCIQLSSTSPRSVKQELRDLLSGADSAHQLFWE